MTKDYTNVKTATLYITILVSGKLIYSDENIHYSALRFWKQVNNDEWLECFTDFFADSASSLP